ncbi:MAG: carboxylesterase family protein [Corynebacterium sp.]|nr:carboxylesterase family protein [Corynebacterium sp.]
MSAVTYPRVQSPAGVIMGIRDNAIDYFHSIPFVEFATDFAPSKPCVAKQELIDATSPHPELIALSITAPATAHPGADLPVVVYIHGGRYEEGTHADPVFTGAGLAQENIIVVRLGYRTKLAGFVPFPGDAPNYYRGISDCMVGLEWVQHNIESFGGDPTNVTLMGHSAGATTVAWLTRKDHYRGAFRQAIILSPCFPREGFSARRRTLESAFGGSLSRTALEKASTQKLSRTYARFRRRYPTDIALGPAPLEPAEMADIPLLIAVTDQELAAIPAAKTLDALRPKWLREYLLHRLALRIGVLAESYDIWRYSITTQRVAGQLLSDSLIRRWAELIARAAVGTTWVIQWEKSTGPALHCEELASILGHHIQPAAQPIVDFIRFGATGCKLPRYTAKSHPVTCVDLESGQRTVRSNVLSYLSTVFGTD